MALLGTLSDPFQGTILNTSLWDATNAANVAGNQAGGQYTWIVQRTSTGDSYLASDTTYDLTGSHLHVELISAGAQETGLETYPIILTQAAANQNNSLFIVIANSTVGFYKVAASVSTLVGTVAYNSTTMRWWRIRESGGTVYYEYAASAQGAWTTQASTTPGITITALYAKIRTYCYSSLSTAKQTAISNVNYVPAPIVDFPDGALPTGLEFAFGADLTASQTTWTWTDVTPVTGTSVFMDQTVTVTRGRADESSDVTPTNAPMELDNPDGYFTPDNPTSIYYPDVDLGTPARWRIEAPNPRLYIPPYSGSRASIATSSALNVSGDIDVRVDLHLKTMHPSGWNGIIAGRADNSGGYSWRLEMEPDRTVTFFWSATGSPPATEAASTIPIMPASARCTLRVTLDINNGAGGYTARFYIGYEGVNGTFTQMCPDVTGSGATSIGNSSEDLVIGHPSDVSSVFALDADVYAFQLRDGIGGTALVDVDFTAQTPELTSFVDSTGLVWNITSPAALTNRWYRAYGAADEWNPIWPWGDLSSQQDGGLGNGEARVELAIAGILRRLGQGTRPLESPLRRAISADSTVVAYWPMEDGEEATQIGSGLPDGLPMSFTGNIEFAADTSDTLLGSKPLAVITATSSFYGPVVATFSGEWQVDQFIYIPLSTPNDVTIMRITGTGTVATWMLTVGSSAITVTGLNAVGATIVSSAIGGTELFDRWVRLRFMCETNGGNIDWAIAWFPVAYPVPSGWGSSGSVAGTVGGVIGVGWPADADASSGITLGHWSVRNSAPVDTYGNAATGWVGDTAVERIIRLCAEEDISLRVIGNPDLSALMGTQQIAALITLLDEAKDADGGILYERPDAVGLIIRTRESLYNQPANMTLDATQEQLQNPFAPTRDDQRMRNTVTVTRRGGSSVVLVDQASIDKSGSYDDSATLNLFADTQIADAAGFRLHQGTIPGMRYPQITTDLGAAPEVIDEWLTVDVGGQVHVTNLPPQHPNTTVRVKAEGYSEPISPVTWKPQLNCSPAEAWDVAVLDGDWVDDQYLLRLESDGSELNASVTVTGTSVVVLVTEGPFWVTGASNFPFDIRVNGERMTVTAIAAPSGSTQTFTVTRSVNGVSRAHSTGEPIALWYRPVLAR